MRRLLLLSNSTDAGGFLTYAQETIHEFLGGDTKEILLVPYASAIESFDSYVAKAAGPFAAMGYRVSSLHTFRDSAAAVKQAQAIVVGGGNTFHLLRRLYDDGLLGVIRARVAAGVPYVGWSAGANIACPSIMTTNDMPIVWLPHLDALGLIPFQINPHYVDSNPSGFYGETRARRILEFGHLHPNVYVVGLPEGGMIQIEGDSIRLLGCPAAKVFLGTGEPVEVRSLEFLEQPLVASAHR